MLLGEISPSRADKNQLEELRPESQCYIHYFVIHYFVIDIALRDGDNGAKSIKMEITSIDTKMWVMIKTSITIVNPLSTTTSRWLGNSK